MITEPRTAGQAEARDDLELRFAVAMNGGVSLAVWIGGVTRELARLVLRDPIYDGLLRCARATASIDVVVGTSAGGINGALLALALLHGNDLTTLRKVWLEDGALDLLLRNPRENNPPSLLRGNEFFLQRLTSAFEQVAAGKTPAAPDRDHQLDLILTTTLLHGEPSSAVDELGESLADTSHRGLLHFRRHEDAARDTLGRSDAPARLAYAARATASFPVAFEPVPILVRDDGKSTPHGAASDMTGIANFRRPHVVMDGGILDNKPIERAIEVIYRRRARGEVRRILAYVTPSLEAPAAPESTDADPASVTLARAAFASLVQLPRHESIAAQLEAILENNREATNHRRRQRTITQYLLEANPEQQAELMYRAYLARRREGAVEYIVAEVADAFTDLLRATNGVPNPAYAFGRRRRELLSAFLLRQEFPWVPVAGSFAECAASSWREALDGKWRWGQYALESMIAVALDLLREGLCAAPPAAVVETAESVVAARQQVAHAREGISSLLQEMPSRGTVWADGVMQLYSPLRPGVTDDTTLGSWWTESLARYASNRREQRLAQIAVSVVTLLESALPALRTIEQSATAASFDIERESAARLGAFLQFLEPAVQAEGSGLLSRLLALEVIEYVSNARNISREQYVELVQFSARGRSPLGGPEQPEEKLAGLQLANFGAFYKRSWRANDWMWGRLDGATRMVRILLDPVRLARVHGRRNGTGDSSAQLLFDQLRSSCVDTCTNANDKAYLEARWEKDRNDLLAELAFIDTPDTGIPEQLPRCAHLFQSALHLSIAREELPVVAEAVEHDQANGAGQTGATNDFLRSYRNRTGATPMAFGAVPTEQVLQLVDACGFGRERIAGEVASDRFLVTATRFAAVVTAALSSSASGLGPLANMVRVLRVPTAAADALARLTVRRSRSTVAVTSALAAVAATLLFVSLLTGAPIGAAILSIAWMVLVAIVAFALFASGWTRSGIWAFVIGLAALFASFFLGRTVSEAAAALRRVLSGV